LLWLAPLAAFRSMGGYLPSFLSLVIIPLLWIAQAMGISFFINCILMKRRWYVIIPSALGILALPFISTTSWWAFFSHDTFLGLLLLVTGLIPAVIFLANRGHLGEAQSSVQMAEGSIQEMEEERESGESDLEPAP